MERSSKGATSKNPPVCSTKDHGMQLSPFVLALARTLIPPPRHGLGRLDLLTVAERSIHAAGSGLLCFQRGRHLDVVVQEFRREVGSVRPGEGMEVRMYIELLEESNVLERLHDRAAKGRSEI